MLFFEPVDGANAADSNAAISTMTPATKNAPDRTSISGTTTF
jgi:hypothetical protein